MGFPVATYFHHVGQAYDCCLKLIEDVAGFPCVHSYLYNAVRTGLRPKKLSFLIFRCVGLDAIEIVDAFGVDPWTDGISFTCMDPA
jgi:hypothetical protein